MGLMDKVKETAQKGADAAKGAVSAGQEKLDDMKVERRIKELKEELGSVVYTERLTNTAGAPSVEVEGEITRLVGEIQVAEAELAGT